MSFPLGLKAEESSPRFVPHSYSGSRDFIVYHQDGALRGAVAGFAEESNKALHNIFRARPDWRRPVIIELHTPPRPPPGGILGEVEVLETDAGIQIRVRMDLARNFDVERFQEILLEGLLMQMAYQNQDALHDEADYHWPPQWLILGISEMLRGKAPERFSRLFAQLMSTETLTPIEAVLFGDYEEMDTVSQAIYQAHCYALVRLLQELPGGRSDFLQFVQSIPYGYGEDLDGLLNIFSALGGSRESLQRWWSLGVARLAMSRSRDWNSLQDSEERLRSLLRIEVPDPDEEGETTVLSIEDYQALARNREARAALSQLQNSLGGFSTVAHPLYRPIIAEYQEVASTLARGRTRRIAEQLEELQLYRNELAERMSEIEDYLNWYEATQTTTGRGAFNSYLDKAKALDQTQSGRSDRITIYMDQMAREFE